MKIILLTVGILCLFLANVSADQVITCEFNSYSFECTFRNATIGPDDDQVTIKTDPEDHNANDATKILFYDSSIHTVPREIFTKFSKTWLFYAVDLNIQEIKPDTFWDAKKLSNIHLSKNSLTSLHRETFKGEYFQLTFFIVKKLIQF
jgi:hypothetical protein